VTNLHEPNPQPAHLPIDLIFSLPISFACKCTALFFLHTIVFATVTTDNLCSTSRCRFVNLRICAYRRQLNTAGTPQTTLRIDTSRTFHLSPFTSTSEELFTVSLPSNTLRPTITRHPSVINLAPIILAPHSAIVH
jgi:hypothetical protein